MTSTDHQPETKKAKAEHEVEHESDPPSKKAKTEATTTLDGDSTAAAATSPLRHVAPDIIPRKSTWAQEYASNQPYPHVVLPHLFETAFLKQVLDEIKRNSTVTFKESDLFKVYQSIDLANLKDDDVPTQETLPSVLQLRQILYSPEWRHFMEDVAGLPRDTLSDRVDCACNCHTTGCHLLCHDDVISTRCLSYIVYLTNEDWTAAEGGALELYPSAVIPEQQSEQHQQRVPDVVPSRVHLPLFNHMAMFRVEPGVSFHAVQEVLGSRPRLSLQGWYHYRAVEDNKDDANDNAKATKQLATLEMLKQKRKEDDENNRNTHDDDGDSTGAGPFVPFPALQEDSPTTPPTTTTTEEKAPTATDSNKKFEMSPADLDFLRQYLNETYLQPSEMLQLAEAFEDESAVQLQDFFRTDHIPTTEQLQTADQRLRSAPLSDYRRGVSETWQLKGPSHKQRFLSYVHAADADAGTAPPSKDPVGLALHQLRSQVLQSLPFARWLSLVTHMSPTASRGGIRRFRPGLDYTVAHHGLLLRPTDPPVLDATVCFVVDDSVVAAAAAAAKVTATTNDAKAPDKDKEEDDDDDDDDEEDVTWESGNVGGFECYIEADDEDENAGPADEYNASAGAVVAEDEENAKNTELLSVSASNNTLSLVLRDPGTMRFIKYVGSRAPSSRWDIAMEYQVQQQDDDDDDGDAGNDKDEENDDDNIDDKGSE